MRTLLHKPLLSIIACCILASLIFWPNPKEPYANQSILVLGDSLSSGYKMASDKTWVSLLSGKLKENAYPHTVINSSISGNTTSQGLSRLPTVLEQHKPGIVILALGSNDGLRGISIVATRSNISKMIELCQQYDSRIILVSFRVPPNMGPKYQRQFDGLFPDLAEKYDLALTPFLLKDVILKPDLLQADRIHPNAKAQPYLLDVIWPVLEPMLE